MAGDNGNDNPVTRSSNGFFASHVGINCYNDFIGLPPEVEHLTVEANCCNEDEFVTLDLTRFHDLKELHVEEGSLKNVKDLKLHGLAALETIEIGEDCFSDADNGTFEISECRKVKGVKVGKGCFSSCRSTVFDGRTPF